MKKFAVFVCFLVTVLGLHAQDKDGFEAYKRFWNKTDSEFRNPEKSPLLDAAISSFDTVPRFEFDPEYRILAEWMDVKKSKPFYFNTTGDIKQKYRKVGIAKFNLKGESCELSIYKNLDLSRIQGFEDYLFIPYGDPSNGLETYGGGKYLSLHAEPKDSLILDFNQSYNPYCAYNDQYSCPIPPEENLLNVPILAGARSDH